MTWDATAILAGLMFLLPAMVMYWAIKTGHRGSPIWFKLVVARVLFLTAISIFGGAVYVIAQLPRRLQFSDTVVLALWLVQSLWWGYLCHLTNRQKKKEQPAKRRPPFFWQGLLILLPVAFMAILAATAIVKDRAAVEQEARQRAAEILQQMSWRFGNELELQHFNFYMATLAWTRSNLDLKIYSPGSPLRPDPTAALGIPKTIQGQPNSAWREVPASLVIKSSVKYPPSFNADGGLRPLWSSGDFKSTAPPDVPPQPPAWRVNLTAPQREAWDALCAAVGGMNDLAALKAAVQKFKQTNPGVEAIENADFLENEKRAWRLPASNAFPQALLTRRQASETGIPLFSLAVADAIPHACAEGVPKSSRFWVWDQLAYDVQQNPNYFSPSLIEMAAPLARTDPSLTECLEALRQHWAALEQMWDFGELIQASGHLKGVTATNFWLTTPAGDWLCTLTPQNTYLSSRIYSAEELSWEFQQAFRALGLSLPRYMELRTEVASTPGPPLIISRPISSGPRIIHMRISGPPAPLLAQSPMAGNDPPYKLQIYLADADAMLAVHRQRALMLGALVLASAMAAAIGFFAARRAFSRQLRLNELKSDFVSSVSHELRAPIASVRLMAEGLERGRIAEPQKQQEYFKFIVQECRRLSSLIENVLDFSRIEQGRKQYELEPTDLAALTQQTVRLMETYAAEKQTELKLEARGTPAPVDLDGKAIQQALINLIDNALKHSPKGSTVTVGLEFATERTSLWVEDHGVGIPASEHEKIFERFYRVGSELRRETQGVGIGLSIVKHIVEAHGGRVTVRSAPGEGSRFTIELRTPNGGK